MVSGGTSVMSFSQACTKIEIDVLIVHTAAVRLAAGGVSGVEAIAEAHTAYTNGVYAASGVVQRLNLVGVEEVNYTETFNTLLDLTRLKEPNDGFMDSVHPLRDARRADCVVMFVAVGAAGTGYLMADVSPDFEGRAFSVVRYDAGPIAFAHELGHNMGASHNNGAGVADAAYCDSFGHRTPDGLWRTIMSNRRHETLGLPRGCGTCLRAPRRTPPLEPSQPHADPTHS